MAASEKERIRELEKKVAYLERHVTEQDKVMLELVEELAMLRAQFGRIREQIAGADAGATAENRAAERPPHY